MRDMGPILAKIERLEKENERLKIAVHIDVSLGNTVCEMHATIESQKEEIEKKDAALLAWMEREDMLKTMYDRLESKKLFEQKAITELAVKGLKEAELNYMGRASYELPNDTIEEMLKPIRTTLSEIARLTHETPKQC